MQFLLTYVHWLGTRITMLYEHIPERERRPRSSHNTVGQECILYSWRQEKNKD